MTNETTRRRRWTYEERQRDGLDVRSGTDFRVVGATSDFVRTTVDPSAGRQVANVGRRFVLLADVDETDGGRGARGTGHPLDVFLDLERVLFC